MGDEGEGQAVEGSAARLRGCVGDAHALLQHAGSRGIALKPDMVACIVEAVHTPDPVPAEKERAFWVAYAELSALVAPVTAESLRETDTASMPRLRFLADERVRFPLAFALAALICILVAQTTYVIVNSRQAALAVALEAEGRAQADLAVKRLQLERQGPAAKGAPAADPQLSVEAGLAFEKSRTEALSATAQTVAASERLRDVNDRLTGVVSGLWRVTFGLIASWNGSDKGDAARGGRWMTRALADCEKAPGAGVAGPSDGRVDPCVRMVAMAQLGDASASLEAFRTFILPILYGLLGGLVFVLQTVSGAITDRSYTRGKGASAMVRIMMGPILGLASTFLIGDMGAKDGVFKGLSPLALAFISGYAVDLLLTFMNRLVKAFSGN